MILYTFVRTVESYTPIQYYVGHFYVWGELVRWRTWKTLPVCFGFKVYQRSIQTVLGLSPTVALSTKWEDSQWSTDLRACLVQKVPCSILIVATNVKIIIIIIIIKLHYMLPSHLSPPPPYGSTALYGPGPPRFVEVSWSHTFETHHSR
jgi:hypothetical protein